MRRKAFTLIELLISVSILSIMMIFLYKSYASLNSSNKFYKNELNSINNIMKKKKVIFLDFSLSLYKSVNILNQDTKIDIVFFQSSNSIHKRYNPYIAYIAKENKLYRLESLQKFKEYPLTQDSDFVADYLGEINRFRVYKSKEEKKETYLIDINFKNEDNILLKVKVLNQK